MRGLRSRRPATRSASTTIKYVSLDDSTAQNPGTADEAQTAQNARKAVQDETTIFYLGEFNSGGTKVSLPILNKAGIPQISPSNTYVGLTTDKPGSEPGEPDKYYPAQTRTYARVVPADDIQGAALVDDDEGGRLQVLHIFNDKTTYGAGLARNIELAAKAAGPHGRGQRRNRPQRAELPVAGREGQGRLLRRLGRDRRELRPGVQGRGGRQPDVKLYGPDGVAEEAFTNPAKGGIPADVGARTKVTVATLGLEEFKKRNNAEAEKFFADFEEEYGDATPDPYAIYGYETMALASTTLEAVGDKANDRKAVAEQLVENTKDRESRPSATTASTRTVTRRSPTTGSTRSRTAADVRQGHQGPGAS